MANPEGWRDGLVKIEDFDGWLTVFGLVIPLFATAWLVDAQHYGFAVLFGGMFLWGLTFLVRGRYVKVYRVR